MKTRFAIFFLLSLVIPSCVVGQMQDSSTQMGSAPYATFQNGDIDNVNLDNGNVFLKIPLVGFPQRGDKLSLNFFIRFNAPRWNVVEIDDGYDTTGGGIVGQWTIEDYNGGAQPIGVDVVRDQFLSARAFDILFPCWVYSYCGYPVPDPAAVLEPWEEFNTVGLYQVRTPDGGMHSYAMASGSDGTTVQTMTPDGSQITNLASVSGTSQYQFLDRNGVTYSSTSVTVSPYPNYPPATVDVPAYNLSDPDGNQITVGANGWTDSIGRLIPGSFLGTGAPVSSTYADPTGLLSPEDDPMPGVPSSDYSRCSGPTTAARQWNVPSANGTTQQYTFCYEDFNYHSAFNVSASGDNVCCYPPGTVNYADASGWLRLLYEIVLPDNTNYQFSYDSYVDLTGIKLPAGGSISYKWASKVINISLTNPIQRVVTSRTVVPGPSAPTSSSGTWQYQWIIPQLVYPAYGSAPSVSEDEYLAESIVTDPNGNDTVHAVQPSGNPSSDGSYDSYTDIIYSGSSPSNPSTIGASGTVLKTITTTRPYTFSPFYTGTDYTEKSPGPPTSITTIYPDGYETKITNTYVPAQSILNYDWGSFGALEIPRYETYDCPCLNYDLVSSTSTYAYGAGSPGALIATSATTYQWQNNPAYLTANLLTLPATVITNSQSTRISETDYTYDENPSPSGTRGHPTTVSRWLNTSSTPVVTKTTFSSYGMPTDTYDANYNTDPSSGNHVHIAYDTTNLFPSSVSQSTTTNGVAHVDYYSYDFNTGLILSHTDQNGSSATDASHTTTFHYVDPLNRLTQALFPPIAAGTPEVNFSYTSSTNTVTKHELQGGGVTLSSSYQYDGLGRTTKTTDTAGSMVDIVYNSIGQTASKTNPYIGTSTDQTTFLYDPLGRMIKQTNQDNSTQWFCYDGQPDPNVSQPNCHTNYSSTIGEWVDVTDEDNQSIQRVQDSLGHLAEVSEFPSGSSGARLETDYLYYPSGNLRSVTQQGVSSETPRQRSFTYDSLSRLITSINPETGTICYGQWSGATCSGGYDPNGNLRYKTDARSVITSYTYDALNRLTSRTYSDGITPAVSFAYDETGDWGAAGCGNAGFVQCNTKGRLSSMDTSDGLSGAVFSYDAMGRMTGKSTCIASLCGSDRIDQFFTYDLAGNLTGYDHGTDVARAAYYGGHNLSYDSAGRLQSVNGYQQPTSPSPLFNATSYGPIGLLESSLGNGLNETRSYDKRMRQVSYNVLNANQSATPSTFSGVVDVAYNNDVVRFPNLTIDGSALPQNGLLTVAGWVGTALSCPVAAVEIDVDQTPIGYASLGVARPDVQQIVYANDGLHPACGYTFTGSIGSVAVGTHSVNAFAIDASGNRFGIPSNGFSITVSSDPPPNGNIDGVLPSQAPITSGGLMTMGGWAIDSQMHAPVGSVKILIDGTPIGYAVLGAQRQDVASSFQDQRYLYSGWNFTGSVANLSARAHIASAIIYDSGGQSFTPADIPITIVADTESVAGAFDTLNNPSNGTSVMPLNGTLYASGWAGEVQDTTSCASNISRVDILVDGNYLGQTQQGISRSDVAAHFGNSSCSSVGWQFTGSVSNIDPGLHTFTIRVYDETGGSSILAGSQTMQLNAQLSPASVTSQMPSQYAWSIGYEPNGNVGYSYDSVNGNSSYLYDSLNRLVASGSNLAGFQWDYDSFGNRLSQVLTSGTGTSRYDTFDQNNRVAGAAYDAAGNSLYTIFGNHLQYDGEGRVAASDATRYIYDAMGQRVAKYNGNTLTNVYLYDNAGHVVTELNGSFAVTRREVYAGNRHLGTYDQSGNLTYALTDWLGTERARADNVGVLCQITTSQPFGDDQQTAGTCFPSPVFFTGKERDAESGLDHFQFRSYASTMGRWMSPDPAGMMAADITDPQSLNRYAYVQNNPLSFVDPLGLDCAYLNDAGTAIEQGGLDQHSNAGECGKSGGYWVDGSITNAQINANAGTVQLTGTNDGTDTTHASYQDTSVYVGWYNNTEMNPFGHIAMAFPGQTPVGFNPKDDSYFQKQFVLHQRDARVPGAVKPQVGGQLKQTVRIPVSGMQAQMIQNAINQSTQNPGNYTLGDGNGCDCGTWAQQMLGDAGINTGSSARLPSNLMPQLQQLYPQH